MSKLLMDSSFMIALLRKNDSLNHKAVNNKSILIDNDCYITDGVLAEVITMLAHKTKDIAAVSLVYNYIMDNFTVLHESEISMYNNNVFAVFKKYNKNNFKVGFVDCSLVVVYNNYDLDYIVSFDNGFKLFEEIKLYDLLD